MFEIAEKGVGSDDAGDGSPKIPAVVFGFEGRPEDVTSLAQSGPWGIATGKDGLALRLEGGLDVGSSLASPIARMPPTEVPAMRSNRVAMGAPIRRSSSTITETVNRPK